MDQSNVMNSESDWHKYLERAKKSNSWVSNAVPDRYPCVCVISHDWDQRYYQNKTCFEFVYADTFGAPEAKAACRAVFDSMSSGEDGFWRAGPWADPDTPEGIDGVVEMLRNVVDQS